MARSILIGVVLCAALSSPAAAQPRDAASVDVLGASIARLMAESRREWTMTWRAFGSRARHIHWHLAEPGPTNEHGGFRRTGWISAGGSQIGLAVCGDELHVFKLVARMSGELPITGSPGLVVALEAAGVTVRPVAVPGSARTYRLSQNGRDGARLVLSDGCTPEGSAASRRCWTAAEVLFRPDSEAAARGSSEPAERCAGLGRG